MSSLEGKTILVVDDEPAIRELFKTEFTYQGCHCLEAKSGQEALEIYKQSKVDAVVSDVRMPNGDGMFFLQKIKEFGEPASFLVFITGYSDIPVDEFYQRGAHLVVQKPFEVDIIVKMIEDSLQVPRSQRRQLVRVLTNMPMAVSWPGHEEPINLLTYNMSRRGFFIQSKDIFPSVNTILNFSISLKTHVGDRTFRGQVAVRWVRKNHSVEQPAGFGVEFVGSDTRPMDELAEIVGLQYLFSA